MIDGFWTSRTPHLAWGSEAPRLIRYRDERGGLRFVLPLAVEKCHSVCHNISATLSSLRKHTRLQNRFRRAQLTDETERRMHHRLNWLIAATITTAVTLTAAPAWTCLKPVAQFQFDDIVVPANVEGALYRHCNNTRPDSSPDFSLHEKQSEDPVDISAHHYRHGLYEIIFEDELQEDTIYQFIADPECVDVEVRDDPADTNRVVDGDRRIWTFETSETEPMPEDIGFWLPSRTTVNATVRYEDEERCTREAEGSYVSFEFDPSDEAEAWGEAIAFETWVNQDPWEPQFGVGETVPAGASRLGWGEERVYTICEEEQPDPQPYAATLEARFQNVQFFAWLPGTDNTWLSESEYARLICPDEDEDGENGENNGDGNTGGDDDGEDEDEASVTVHDDDRACSQTDPTTTTTILVVLLLLLMVSRRSGVRTDAHGVTR